MIKISKLLVLPINERYSRPGVAKQISLLRMLLQVARRVEVPVQREAEIAGGEGEGEGVGGRVHVQPAVVHAFWSVFVSQTLQLLALLPLKPGIESLRILVQSRLGVGLPWHNP